MSRSIQLSMSSPHAEVLDAIRRARRAVRAAAVMRDSLVDILQALLCALGGIALGHAAQAAPEHASYSVG
ncbi:MAG: hypothetical protein V4724_12810 [Pseudomonadota bacterium]